MASYENSVGATQLVNVWRDPDFNSAQPAFYYAWFLQIPTPRHSLYDAVAMEREKAEKIGSKCSFSNHKRRFFAVFALYRLPRKRFSTGC